MTAERKRVIKTLHKAMPVLRSAVHPRLTGKIEDWHGEYAYSLGLATPRISRELPHERLTSESSLGTRAHVGLGPASSHEPGSGTPNKEASVSLSEIAQSANERG